MKGILAGVDGGNFVKAGWCGCRACEDKVKEETGATSRVIVEGESAEKCAVCGEKAEKMITEEAIYQETVRKCREMVDQTQFRMAELRRVSNEYMDDALRRTEEAINLSLNDVRDTRSKFMALVEAQEKRAATQDVEI
jgi:hypothetical protein